MKKILLFLISILISFQSFAQINFQVGNRTITYTPVEDSCTPPANLVVNNITASSADLNWDTDISGNYWEVQYKKNSDTVWNAGQIVYLGEYSLANLDPETTYDVRVKSVCNNSESVWSIGSFTTDCGIITTLPWTDSFDTYGVGNTVFPTCWTRNPSYVNVPYIYFVNYSPPGSLYFYTVAGVNHVVVTPEIDVSFPINTVQATFMYRTTFATDTLFLGVMTDPADVSTFEQVAFVTNSSTNTWYSKEVLFNNYTGIGQYVAFMVRNGTVYLDDVVIDLIPLCPKPTNISVVSAATDQLEIGWQENGTATSWIFEYKKVTDSIWTLDYPYTNPHTIYNLESATQYMIRIKSYCSGEESDYSEIATIMTACEPIETLPWNDSFDTYGTGSGVFPPCWSKISSNSYPCISNTNSFSSPGAMYMYTTSGAYNYAITPEFASFIDISTLIVHFQLYKMAISNTIEVGVISDPQDMTTFESVATLTPTNVSTWEQFTVNFASYTGTGQYIAFKVQDLSYNNRIYIDDVWIGFAPSCNTPTGLTSIDTGLTESSITLDWDGAEDSNVFSWNIFYRHVGATDWETVEAFYHPFILIGLEPNLVYEIMISANCLVGEPTLPTNIISVGMPCVPITDFPWSEGFEGIWYEGNGLSTGSHPWCWININGGSGSGSWAKTTYSNYVRTGNSALQMYSSSTVYIHDDWFISPVLSLTGNEQLSFWVKAYSTTDILSVKIFDASMGPVSTESDTSDFIDLMPNTVIPTFVWTEYELNLSQYVGNYQFAFVRNTAGGYILNIDDVLVEPLPDCASPTDVSVVGVTHQSAEIDFIPASPALSAWFLYYKPQSSTDWDSVYIYNYPYILTGLSPEQTYQFYLRTDCGEELSEPTPIGTFTTACVPIATVPWTEGFEDLAAASTLPQCWAATGFGTYTNTQITNYGSFNRNARTGTGAAYFRYGCNDRFFSPGFQLQAGVSYEFSFWYVTDGYNGWQTLEAGVYSAQNSSALIQTLVIAPSLNNTTYQKLDAYFTPEENGVYYFGIYCRSTSSPQYITLDDFSLDLAPDCLPLTQLQVSNIAGSSAYLTWTSAGNPDFFSVEIENLSTNTTVIETTTDYFYLLIGLNEQTYYSVSVYPLCSGQEGMGDTIQFKTDCFEGGDLIVGTPDATTNSQGAYLPITPCYSYSLSEQIYDAAELLNVGDSIYGLAFQFFYLYPITRNIEIYLGHTGKTTFNGVSDCVPGSSLTLVYQGSVTWTNTNPDYWVEINFTAPFAYDSDSNLVVVIRDMTNSTTSSVTHFRTHATQGTKALYFIQNSGGPISITAPSGSGSNAVSNRNNIKFLVPCIQTNCIKPNIILANFDTYSATFMIAPGMNETSWEGEYKVESETDWTSLGVITDTDYILDSLVGNTSYLFRLRSICGTEQSNWKAISFTTLCGNIDQLPFVENFDSYPYGSIPTCWSKLNSQGSHPYISNHNPISTPHSAYFYSTANHYATLILPPLGENIDITTVQMVFWARTVTLGHQLEVGVMTDPLDNSTFTVMGTAMPSILNTYQEFEVNFNTYTGTGRYIAIRANGSCNIYVDDLILREMADCVRPSGITFSSILGEEATVSWLAAPTAVHYEIVYGLTGIDPDNEIPYPVYDTFVTLYALTANTLYEVYVRSVCIGGDTSEWTVMTSFLTGCGVIGSFPWTDSFDTYGVGSSIFPPCWTRIATLTNSLCIDNTNFSPPGSLWFKAYLDNYSIAVTPKIHASVPVNTLRLSFMYRTRYPTDTLFIGVMTDPNNAATFEEVTFVTNATPAMWYAKEVFFSNYTGSGQYIAFKVCDRGTAYNVYAYVDDVEIDLLPNCPEPAGLYTTNVTQTSLDLGWVELGTATTWEIKYGVEGSTPGTDTIVQVSTNPATITGLTVGTCYDFYVRSVCAIGDTSDWSNKRTFCTSYAPVNVPFNFDFETESGFLFANTSGTGWYIGNAPGVNVTLNGVSGLYISADNGFTNSYTATPAVVWAYRDIYFTPSASNYVMTFEWKCQGEATNDYFHIYIGSPMTPDTSNTGLITLPVGATPLATFMNQKPTWQETSRTLPAADYSGQHKRLYICWRNDDVTVNQPPATIDNLKITSADFSECLSPVSLFVDNITSNSATAYWGGNAAGWGVTYSWQFEYKKAEDTTWTTQNVHNRTYTMTGLQPSTPYDTRVKAICIGGQESFYTPIVSFTTPATPCVTPTNLQVSNVTNNSALATWTAGGSEPSWQVEYKLASADNWIANTTNTPSFTITGLQSSTLYHVRVKAICTSEESTFTDHVTFLTGGNTTYTIVATAGPHGTITPSGVVTVYQSGSQTFIFTPDAGCRIDVVLVDNVPQVPVPETYTFENIQGNHTIHVDFAEGIAENDLSRYVTLYPNPTQSLIDLKLDIDYLGTTQCRIYDMYGKLMHIFSIEEEITTIDVTYFASGIYFIHLTTEQGQVSKRFVKQ